MTTTSEGIGEAPPPTVPPEEIAAYLTRGFGCPEGYFVSRVVRYGGRQNTGLAVFIDPPGGGKELRIHFERESDCTNPMRLRAQAAADTRGLTRGSRINSPKAAASMFEAMCSLADHFEQADEHVAAWEWVQVLRHVAAEEGGATDSYASLKRLQDWAYSKALVLHPPHDSMGALLRPIPPLLVDDDGNRYITAGHLRTFLHHDLGVEGAGSGDLILSRLLEIGGERMPVQQWNADRTHKVTLVLLKLPQAVSEEERE